MAHHTPAYLLWFLQAQREERRCYLSAFPAPAVLFQEAATGQGHPAVPPVKPSQGDACGRDAPNPQLDFISPWRRPAT